MTSFSAYSQRSRTAGLWRWVAVTLVGIIVLWYNSCRCQPPNTICISGSQEPPFMEYFDVCQCAALYKVQEKLHSVKSFYQQIEVYRTSFFGNLLVIDQDVMLTERDEKHYHEMIAHIPLNYISDAQKVLIIGGGDGGTLREVLRHPNVVTVVMVEIDKEVVETSRVFFPKLATGFSDPRTQLIFDDGAKWAAREKYSRAETFDVVLVDSTDYNAALSLFTNDFYENIKEMMLPHGILVFNVDTPSFALDTIRQVDEQMTPLFRNVFFYQTFQPTYLSGHYAFAFLSDEVHPMKTEIDWGEWNEKNLDCFYYNPNAHHAAFVLPYFVKNVVRGRAALADIPS